MDNPKIQRWLQAAHQLLEDWDSPELVEQRQGKQQMQLYQVFHSLTGEQIIVEADNIDTARRRAGLAVGLTAKQAKREMVAVRLSRLEE